MDAKPVSEFLDRHFRHFNAAALIDASDAYRQHLDAGGKMMITLAGAMSTAELGISLAEMIRQDKVRPSAAREPTWKRIFSIWSRMIITGEYPPTGT